MHQEYGEEVASYEAGGGGGRWRGAVRRADGN